MKKKINIRFMIISAAAIIITAVISTLLFYNVLQEQVFSDLEAYEHVVNQVDPEDLKIDKEALQKICAETTPECIHHFDKVLIESEYVHIDNTLNCVSLMSTFTIEQNIFRMIL